MRRSHVERRSYKYAAVQYVSETHEHKPDAPTRTVAVLERIAAELLAAVKSLPLPE